MQRWLKNQKQTNAQTFSARRTGGRGDNELLMKSVTENRATWVRGVKFSTYVVHAVMKTVKMTTVAFTCEAHFRRKCVQRLWSFPTLILSCCNHQHTVQNHITCIVLQLHLLKDLCSAGCFGCYTHSPLYPSTFKRIYQHIASHLLHFCRN